MQDIRPNEGDKQEQAHLAEGETVQSVAEQKPVDEVESLRNEVQEWRTKAEEYLDNYKRSLAEFSNYRKRQEREREQQMLRVSMDVLRRLLPVMDDLDRAVKAIPPEYVGSNWVEGILLIGRKLKSLLEAFHVVPIEALGKPFDPNFHSAVMSEESETYPAGIVMEELQCGYMLADQVLRPTMVKVSNGPGSQAKQSSEN